MKKVFHGDIESELAKTTLTEENKFAMTANGIYLFKLRIGR